MPMSAENKAVANAAVQQVRDVASGLSGNRRYVLERSADSLAAVIEGATDEAKEALDPSTPAPKTETRSRKASSTND